MYSLDLKHRNNGERPVNEQLFSVNFSHTTEDEGRVRKLISIDTMIPGTNEIKSHEF